MNIRQPLSSMEVLRKRHGANPNLNANNAAGRNTKRNNGSTKQENKENNITAGSIVVQQTGKSKKKNDDKNVDEVRGNETSIGNNNNEKNRITFVQKTTCFMCLILLMALVGYFVIWFIKNYYRGIILVASCHYAMVGRMERWMRKMYHRYVWFQKIVHFLVQI